MAQAFRIDIVSDVVCPWCYVGKRNVEAAVAARPDLEIAVHWRPYRLDPTIPPQGRDRREYMRLKFGPDIEGIHARLAQAGRSVGLELNFDRIERAPDTTNAHRLLHWALTGGPGGADVQNALAERLFADYFTNGRDVGARETLVAAADSVGMDGAAAGARLDGDEDRDTIRDAIIEAQDLGVTGVPFIILAGRYALPGAQPPETILRALEKTLARAERDGGEPRA